MDPYTITATDQAELLAAGKTTSQELVQLHYQTIKRHDDYLHAMIATRDLDALVQQAKELDEERRAGNLRSPLHGVPILLKDNIATAPELGMDTTAGSYALVGSKTKRDALIVKKIRDAGLIIIGKANLSEFSFWKGSKIICGWSAVGGQTQSAYVRGGVQEDDTFGGFSNPGGSSSGSAVGVSAGYAPLSIGTETDGSLVMPANRAALYTIKPTIGLVSQDGIIPICSLFDAAGPMTKSARDLALLLDVIVEADSQGKPKGGYISAATGSWEGLKIGSLDPSKWDFPADLRKPLDGAVEQIHQAAKDAYDVIAKHAEIYREHVDLVHPDALEINGECAVMTLAHHHFQPEIEDYLKNFLESSPVRSLAEIIAFNEENAEKELPPPNSNQETLLKSLNFKLPQEEYEQALAYIRRVSRTDGLDKTFAEYGIDIIVGPAESALSTFASASGYPIATLPVGYIDANGAAHGLVALARAHDEQRLIQLQSAWEKSYKQRLPPSLLYEA